MRASLWCAAVPIGLAALLLGCDESLPVPDATATDGRVETSIPDLSRSEVAHTDLAVPDQGESDGPVPNPSWVIFGGSFEVGAAATAIAADNAGNSYVGGNYAGGAITLGSKTLPASSSGTSGSMSFVAKLDPAGQVLWAKALTNGADDCGIRAIAVDAAGQITIAGKFKGNPLLGSIPLISFGNFDGYVARLDPAGKVLWATSFGGPGTDTPTGIAVDKAGEVFTTGSFAGTSVFGSTALTSSGSLDVFVARLSTAGKISWVVRGGGADLDPSGGIAVDGAGGLRVSAFAYGPSTYGTFTVSPKSDMALVVARLDASGKFLWASQADAKYLMYSSVAVDGAGHSYVTGGFAVGQAAFGTTVLSPSATGPTGLMPYVAKLDASGNHVWAAGGGTDRAEPRAITVDGKGNSYITGQCASCSFGTTTLTSYGLRDIFVAKLDAQGAWSKVVSAGGSLDDESSGIAIHGAGNALVAGRVMFDPYDLTGLGTNTDKLTFSGQQYTLTGRPHMFIWNVLASAL